MIYKEITDKILKCFYKVYNELGYGFLEKVYEKAMFIELSREGLDAKTQYGIEIFYDGCLIGEYCADILVNEKIIIELKAVDFIRKEHEAQLLNYLKATKIEIGFLLNFGKKPMFKRMIFSNENKNPYLLV